MMYPGMRIRHAKSSRNPGLIKRLRLVEETSVRSTDSPSRSLCRTSHFSQRRREVGHPHYFAASRSSVRCGGADLLDNHCDTNRTGLLDLYQRVGYVDVGGKYGGAQSTGCVDEIGGG